MYSISTYSEILMHCKYTTAIHHNTMYVMVYCRIGYCKSAAFAWSHSCICFADKWCILWGQRHTFVITSSVLRTCDAIKNRYSCTKWNKASQSKFTNQFYLAIPRFVYIANATFYNMVIFEFRHISNLSL